MINSLLKLLPYATAILCGGGAAETFKERHAFLGIPMFVLGVLSFGLWFTIWISKAKRS